MLISKSNAIFLSQQYSYKFLFLFWAPIRVSSLIGFDLLISIEGGYEQVNNIYFIVTYASIIDNKNNEFIGKSQGLQISKAMFDWVSDGNSLNKVIESIVENSENKKANGISGYLTNGFYKRDIFDSSAIVSALQPYINHNQSFQQLERRLTK